MQKREGRRMNREKEIKEALKALGIRTESDLRAAIKKTTVNISTMVNVRESRKGWWNNEHLCSGF